MTWAQFYVVFLEKYVPRTLRNSKRDNFMAFEKVNMYVATYETKLYALSHYSTQLLDTEEERILVYVKGLNSELQVRSFHMNSAGKIFNKVTDYVKTRGSNGRGRP
ncbi:hypothetical protein R3W88_029833 [Solanum pinnatisectum]|uniref:Retrotransposon gag domain-containing protein n=1 Tax=Solanum pinnatisectum TaxID=50273 RepID=A0AAV9K6G5_9SOLN|nr:hypothetical protein R3W88_029833 [Solanum pinnatisectum]